MSARRYLCLSVAAGLAAGGLLVACGGPPQTGITTIEIVPSSSTIEVGSTYAFEATAKTAAGAAVTATFTWKSSNPVAASIVGGVVTGLAPGTSHITASAGGVTSAATLVTVVAATSPTSYQLIDQALERGEIDTETALAYKVFATFADARLPAEYQSDDAGRDGTLLLSELSRRLSSLSQSTRSELAPFLLPPPVPGSWFAASSANGIVTMQVEWATVITANDEVKIWYRSDHPQDATRAATLAAEIDGHLWPTLTGLLREPMPDCGATCPEGGGDSRVDIYLVRVGRSAVVGASNTGPTSAYMLLEPDESFGIVAHEFAHLIQFAYPVASADEYDWLFEATAQWAMDYAYPAANSDPDFPASHEEQDMAASFLTKPSTSLETVNDDHEYGTYLFPFYLAGQGRAAVGVIRTIWEKATMSDSLAAVNSAIADRGGFEEVWPLFTQRNWNQDPVADYRDWDQLTEGASPKISFGIGAPGKDQLDTDVPHLAAFYYHFTFTTEKVKSVVIDNPYAAGADQHAHVNALAKIGGQWRAPEDWTRLARKRYCREQPAEHIEELVIIVSNSAWNDRSHVLSGKKIDVDSRELGCTCDALAGVTNWIGTGGFTYQVVADDGLDRLEQTVGASVSAEFGSSTYGGSGTLTGSTNIDQSHQVYDPQGTLHFAASIGGSGQPVAAPFQDDESVLVLVLDPLACRYTVGVRAYVQATATDIVGATTEIVVRTGSFSTAWRSIPDDLNLSGSGSFTVHSTQYILGQPDLIDAFLLDNFYVHSILGEQGMGNAMVSWSLAPVPQ